MQIKHIGIENFRNIKNLQLDISKRTFVYGINAQGKTNLLEALSLLLCLKSFKDATNDELIMQGESVARVRVDLESKKYAKESILIDIYKDKKQVYINGQKLKSFSEILGRYPAIVMSAFDMNILRGSPSERRKFLDILISSCDKTYLENLKIYARCLAQRNTLLKSNDKYSNKSLFFSFEKAMSSSYEVICSMRELYVEKLNTLFQSYCQSLSKSTNKSEEPLLKYKPNCSAKTKEDFFAFLEKNREKEFIIQSTINGVHKDDMIFSMSKMAAKKYSSEGQQKSMILALKMAQGEIIYQKTNINPAYLCDDVLGELDENRQNNFWLILPQNSYIFATGTIKPKSENWQYVKAENGIFTKE